MIDNIRFRIENKESFEKNIIENDLIDLKSTINYSTGENLNYRKHGKLHNLQINITQQAAYITGSIHKFYNNLKGKGNINHNDFSYKNCIETINFICNYFSIDKKKTTITNLEFGFNLDTNYIVNELIRNNIVLWNFDEHDKRQKYKSKGICKEFGVKDYKIKIYDKGKESPLKSENLMRVELRIYYTRVLERLGISNLSSINIDAFKHLYKEFYKQFDKLLIVDSLKPSNLLEFHDAAFYLSYTKFATWEANKKTKKTYDRDKDKKKLLKIIQQQGYDKMKNHLIELIENKYNYLMK